MDVGAGGGCYDVAPAVGYDAGCGAADSGAEDAAFFDGLHEIRIAWTGFERCVLHVDEGDAHVGVGVGE